MRTSTADEKLRALSLRLMQSPTDWPTYPYLPMVRRNGTSAFGELALLCDAAIAFERTGFQTTLFVVNLYEAQATVKTFDDLLKHEHRPYDSLAAILDDGWRVD